MIDSVYTKIEQLITWNLLRTQKILATPITANLKSLPMASWEKITVSEKRLMS